MARAIEEKGSLTVGHFALGMRGGVTGSVRQVVLTDTRTLLSTSRALDISLSYIVLP